VWFRIADTRWEGSVIVVLNDTRISPPYDADSVTGDQKTVQMIKNRVVSGLVEDRHIILCGIGL